MKAHDTLWGYCAVDQWLANFTGRHRTSCDSSLSRHNGFTAYAVISPATNSSTCCRRCLRRRRPSKRGHRHAGESPAFCRSRGKMPGFARLRSGCRTCSGTCLPERGRMRRDLATRGRLSSLRIVKEPQECAPDDGPCEAIRPGHSGRCAASNTESRFPHPRLRI